ncbi:hypothetical protein H2198_010782 [Neophaeococcomyces mojaviensis]|uniref:Uncharacterized protein n=1 Tax=Neophaeococcomyces mojaviensis TaxID=3383035 RepID=A0ACC2ZQJ9_9EURO|nr:hypothetical protein H2198_010782 [Knufia sp. JES_112]
MALLTVVTHPLLTAVVLPPFLFLLVRLLYRVSPFHPLAHVPGPILPRVSSLWLIYHAWIGDECTVVHGLHERYGPIVRTGPFSVDIADGEALHDIYSAKGGFLKAVFYGNFAIDGHASIFSEIVPEKRAPRAKAVLPLFATGNLRTGKHVLEGIVQRFVRQVQKEAEVSRREDKAVNLLDLTRGLAVDAVTGYLFGRAYGGIEHGMSRSEKKAITAEARDGKTSSGGMSANGMVDIFVSVGRFWYLPDWAFQWVEWLDNKFGAGSAEEVGVSIGLVDDFVAGIVNDAATAIAKEKADANVNGVTPTSYPGRLLSAGISVSETRAQCKDLIFAGTDSTGMNLATIIFYLMTRPKTYQKLRDEVLSTEVTDLMEIQAMPYLRGVVREGLRLSMANPSRLPRVVPPSGWTFKDVSFPFGTEVSCTPYELHLNPKVFPEPLAFRPERWVEDATSNLMERDAIPFGLGPRQCIARNLATAELFLAVKALAEQDCLQGAKAVGERIEILEWFNSHVVGEKIEAIWT